MFMSKSFYNKVRICFHWKRETRVIKGFGIKCLIESKLGILTE